MPMHTLKVEMDLPDGVDGDELVGRVSPRLLDLLASEAELMAGGDAVIRQARAEWLALFHDRVYLSFSDPRIRPLQREVLVVIDENFRETHSPKDVAKKLAKTFPHVFFDWLGWLSDESTIAHCRQQLRGMREMGFSRYEWVASECSCIHCRALESGGPYTVEAGPLPVIDSHSGCMCVLSAHAE